MNKWTRPFEGNRASAAQANPPPASLVHHYFAFLSYSHGDSAEADWLHDELEQFRVPSSLAGRLTANGVIPKRLTPIFRDRHELAAAHDLNVEIRQALELSRCLIVLCSPAAAQSKWVNAEIDQFKRIHPEGCVIAAVVGGEPLASQVAGREAEECFPPALLAKYDRKGRPTGHRVEPLAADLREGHGGRRVGFLKIVAGILGVGLDDLVQRDQLRRQRRLALISTGSVVGMVVAAGLAVTAIQARDEARDQRRQAESLVEFMLGDLKDKLEPIGRLDVLDSVGAKALAYYEKQKPSELSDEALAQRSKALSLLGQVASGRGDVDAALKYYQEALNGTAEALRRSPDDPQRIYDQAQNVFYIGELAWNRGNLDQAVAGMREYKRLARQLIATDPSKPEWQMEGIYADTNLGVMLLDQKRFDEAAAAFKNALVDRERLAASNPGDPEYKKALVTALSWLATANEKQGRLEEARAAGNRQLEILAPMLGDPRSDQEFRRLAAVAERMVGRVSAEEGNVAEATRHLQASLALADRLVATDQENTLWMGRSAWARFELARVKLAGGDTADASRLVREGCDIGDRLYARDQSVVEWRLLLRSACLETEGRVALASGSYADARAKAEQLIALAGQEKSSADFSNARISQSSGYFLLGLAHRGLGDRDGASKAFGAAASAWPQPPSQVPYDLARQAAILKAAGKRDEANAIESKLRSIGYREPLYLRDLAASA